MRYRKKHATKINKRYDEQFYFFFKTKEGIKVFCLVVGPGNVNKETLKKIPQIKATPYKRKITPAPRLRLGGGGLLSPGPLYTPDAADDFHRLSLVVAPPVTKNNLNHLTTTTPPSQKLYNTTDPQPHYRPILTS